MGRKILEALKLAFTLALIAAGLVFVLVILGA